MTEDNNVREGEWVLVRWRVRKTAKGETPHLCHVTDWERWCRSHEKNNLWEEVARGTQQEVEGFVKLMKELK